jgi:flavin-dependent dehydrogenase
MSSVDVAVVGGGPGGAAAALTLARAGASVAILERSSYDRPRIGETLPPHADHLLHRLGVADVLVGDHVLPSFGNTSVWGDSAARSLSFIFAPHGAGTHVVRERFDELLAAAAASGGARLETSASVVSCRALNGDWEIGVRSAGGTRRILRSRYLIDATGRRSALAQALGARRRVYDHLVAVTAYYRAPAGDGGYTLVEAMANGWWYSAPIPPDRIVVTLMTDADLCRRNGVSEAASWDEALALTTQSQRRVAGADRLSRPSIASAITHRLDSRHCGGRSVSVGDAAMGVDPLSSSGIVRSLLSGETAAQAIAAVEGGATAALDEYELWLDEQFEAYLDERAAQYALENRWPDEPFWKRRHRSGARYSASRRRKAPARGAL